MRQRTGKIPVDFDPMVITIGDPCGIGPEVVHEAVKKTTVLRRRDVLVVGDVLPYARAVGEAAEMHMYHIVPFDDFLTDPEAMVGEFLRVMAGRRRPFFLDLGDRGDDCVLGQGSVPSGELSVTYLEAAFELLDNGIGSSLVTAPISKRWIQEAGFNFPGHTEAIAARFDGEALMVMAGGGLKVGLTTIHEPLAGVTHLLTKERVKFAIESLNTALVRDFGIRDPRVAVCGFNPHAGEEGRFGHEERDIIEPVVKELAAEGYNVSGPFPGDSVFVRSLSGEFDGVVAMYHDQGLIPVKLLAFDTGVNFTANLKVVRTSPDHGTAYGIAGKGLADSGAMLAAIELADAIARRRQGERVSPTIAEMPYDPVAGKQTAKLTPRQRARKSSGRVPPVGEQPANL